MFRYCVGKANQILRKGVIGSLRGYQYVVSPLIGHRCRFFPSCSDYAIEALETHHLVKAVMLITWRLLRCHPFGPGGYDPVIANKFINHSKVKSHVR